MIRLAYSFLVALAGSLMLAFALYVFGTGLPFRLMFGFFFFVLSGAAFYHAVRYVAPTPAGGTPGTPLMPRLAAMVVTGMFIAIALAAFAVPMGHAIYTALFPDVAEATAKRSERAQLSAAIVIAPNDTDALRLIKAEHNAEMIRINRWLAAQLESIEEKIPDDVQIGSPEYEAFMKEKDKVQEIAFQALHNRRQKTLRAALNTPGGEKLAAEMQEGFVASRRITLVETLRTFHVGIVVVLIITTLLAIASILAAITAAISHDTKALKSSSSKAVVWAGLTAGIFLFTLFWQEIYGVRAEASGFYPDTQVVVLPAQAVTATRGIRLNEVPPQFIRAEDFQRSTTHWVGTKLFVGEEPLDVIVTGNGLRNGSMPICTSEGCVVPQIDGDRLSNAEPHMAVLGKVGKNGEPFFLGQQPKWIDPQEFGSGEIYVIVNQVLDQPEVWDNLNGGLYVGRYVPVNARK